MWIILENPKEVRGKKYEQLVNIDNGNRIYIDIVRNQNEIETDLHIWGNWTSHSEVQLFTGSESECIKMLGVFAKRLNVQRLPREGNGNAKKGIN